MESNTAADTDVTPRRDDAYWAALFRQEQQSSPNQPPSPQPPPLPVPQRPDWAAARRAAEEEAILELMVIAHNKGGLLVSWKHLPGFVPASQIVDLANFHILSERQKALEAYVGRTLCLRIIELDETANRFILSERAALAQPEARDRRLAEVQPGDRYSGQITNLTDFGAFVDLGGIEGLIHISELSYARITHPSDVVAPGQKIEVVVLNVDRQKERIGLSLKQVRPDPWLNVEKRYEPDQLVTGTVRRIASYGAFVSLEQGLDALVHISEMADGSFPHPRYVVREGQVVRGRVLKVDGQQRRLSLTMRGVEQPGE